MSYIDDDTSDHNHLFETPEQFHAWLDTLPRQDQQRVMLSALMMHNVMGLPVACACNEAAQAYMDGQLRSLDTDDGLLN